MTLHPHPVLRAAAAVLLACLAPGHGQSLQQQFQSPPADSRPGCYWYWINDNISKEGITRDLEAMARVGIGRAYIGHIYNHDKPADTPVGDTKMFSPGWWEAVQWAVKEAGRCGVDIGFFNSPGWSQSGGPWVAPAQSMRYLAASDTVVDGGRALDLQLPLPAITTQRTAGGSKAAAHGAPFTADDYQDVLVIAFKQPAAEADEPAASGASPTLKDHAHLFDGDPATTATIAGEPQVIDLTFAKPQALQSLRLDPASHRYQLTWTAESIADDGTATAVGGDIERRGHQGPRTKDPLWLPLIPVITRHLRVTLSANEPATFSAMAVSRRAVVAHHARKQLGETSPATTPAWNTYQWPAQPPVLPGTTIDPAGVIDLTRQLEAGGRLRWNAPPGRWVIQRLGMLPTGAQCAPASPEGIGLETDKMSKTHIRDHFDAMVGEFLERTPAADRSALKYVIADSYETGPQNWTDHMLGLFETRFGYSPVPYLPALGGRVVASPDVTNRFLWDWRRLIADSIAHDYVGGLREVANEHGLKLWLENYGHWGFPSEFLLYGSQADEVGGEFWESATIHDNIECRAAASCAHTYGRRDVYAEAFTSTRNFKQSPADLKSSLDWVFSTGINHLILHVYIHQPDERPPGIIQWFGTAFNRHNTWFEPGKAFIDYVRRCSVLLKHGTPAIDIAYFIGEDAPVMTGPLNPPLPDGYDYDHINADVLIHRTTVKDGRLCIENGPSYALLVLPDLTTMTPKLAAAIRQLVHDGATIVGPRPKSSPSLAGYPHADADLAKLTAPLWPAAENAPGQATRIGAGRVFAPAPLTEVLTALGMAPDLTIKGSGMLACAAAGNGRIGRDDRGGIVFKHRSAPDAEIYFLANTTTQAKEFNASFRVSGRQPTFWNPVTGETSEVLAFTQEDGRTQIPLRLERSESVFVVFGAAIDPQHSGPALTNTAPYAPLLTLDGPWQVTFDGLGAPAPTTFETLVDWTKHPDPAIQPFSGSATYTTRFRLDEVPADPPLRLRLGKVGVIAEVAVNGKAVGTVWTHPWSIDLRDCLQPGDNTLAIRVTNTWNNRLVSDAKKPAAERLGHISQAYRIDAKAPTRASGLIGPVVLVKAP